MTYRAELLRKTVHLSMLALPVWMVSAPPEWRMRGLLLAFFLVLAVDLARLTGTPLRRALQRWIGASLRPGEVRRPTSAHYLTATACLFAWLLPQDVGAAALAIAIAGDAAAALVGRRLGRHRVGRKSLEGILANFLAGTLVGWCFVPASLGPACVAAAIAAIVEALPLRLDDNLVTPWACALVLHGLL